MAKPAPNPLWLILAFILAFAYPVYQVAAGPEIFMRLAATTTTTSPPAGIALNLNIQTAQSGGGNDTTITKPTGTADGDFLLAAIAYSYGRTWSTVPSGWTQLDTYDYNSNSNTIRVWYKRASSEGSSYTWSTDLGDYTDGAIWRITGVVSSGDPSDASPSHTEADGTSVNSTAITTGTNGSAVIQVIGFSNDSGTKGSTTLTNRFSDGVTLMINADTQASSGSSGNKSAAWTTSRVAGAILLAIKPQ